VNEPEETLTVPALALRHQDDAVRKRGSGFTAVGELAISIGKPPSPTKATL